MKTSTSRELCADLKSALVVALQLAEKGVDGLPIPGVKGCIGGILRIIELEESRKSNIDTFKDLGITIQKLRNITEGRLLKERHIPEYLKSDVEDLVKTLSDIPGKYDERVKERSRMRRWKDFCSAHDDAKALNGLAGDLKSAIDKFMAAALVNIQLEEQRREDDRLIDKLPVEHKAFYNAHRDYPTEVCEPDTRVSLLNDVATWAKGTGPHYPGIFWLNGPAGFGKSTIAKTLATRFDVEETLGGTFMFSKPNGVTDGSKVFTTLAYQLARRLPGFRDHLATAIRTKEDSIKAEIPQQFDNLLVAPLSQVQSPPLTVIIFDALDECSPETLTSVLAPIVESIAWFPFLRIVITSRPESSIQELLQRFTEHMRIVDIGDIPTSQDIATYLQRRLSNAYSHVMGSANQYQAWPTDCDLGSLVNMANNLFIFAAIAVRFIAGERASDPQRRLEIILRGQHEGRTHPFSTLDAMYREILRNALPEGEVDLHERFQTVVGTIIFSPNIFSVSSLVEFLKPTYTARDIRHSLKFLHSVLIVPKKDEERGLRAYHKSFVDFMTDSRRCTLTEAYLPPSTHHMRLCLRRFQIARSTFDTLSGASYVIPPDSDFPGRPAEYILDIVTLGIRCWLHHLQKHADENQGIMGDEIQNFKLVVLHSIEAFLESLRGQVQLVNELDCGLDSMIPTLVMPLFDDIQMVLEEGITVVGLAPTVTMMQSALELSYLM